MKENEKPDSVLPEGARRPQISIVIPVYNEQAILHAAVIDLRERLESVDWTYEIILAENGSRDDTLVIAQLSAPEVSGLAAGDQVTVVVQPTEALATAAS